MLWCNLQLRSSAKVQTAMAASLFNPLIVSSPALYRWSEPTNVRAYHNSWCLGPVFLGFPCSFGCGLSKFTDRWLSIPLMFNSEWSATFSFNLQFRSAPRMQSTAMVAPLFNPLGVSSSAFFQTSQSRDTRASHKCRVCIVWTPNFHSGALTGLLDFLSFVSWTLFYMLGFLYRIDCNCGNQSH